MEDHWVGFSPPHRSSVVSMFSWHCWRGTINHPPASRQRIQWIVVTSAITAMTSLIPFKGNPGPMPGEDAKVNY